jgi:TRAP-type C4-dicarboxylate transport system permease large subunit
MFDAQILAQNVINGADSFPLLAFPFFMLAGEIMNVGGLSQRIVNFALALVGHIKGGLGYVAILAAILLSALSGSAVADAAALTALLLPMMVKAGHDKARSGGLIAAAGVIGPVIPPSIGFVIFGVAANVSISKAVPGRHLPRHPDRPRAVDHVDDPGAQGEDRSPAAQVAQRDRPCAIRCVLGADAAGDHPRRSALRRLHADRGGRGCRGVRAVRRAVIYRELKLAAATRCSSRRPRHRVIMFLVPRRWFGLADHGGGPAEQGDRLLEPFMGNQTLLLIAIMVLCMVVGTAMDMTPPS